MIIDYNEIVNKLVPELNTRAARAKLIASNVANVDTPGYKSVDLQFQDELEKETGNLQMKITHQRHMTEYKEVGLANNNIVESPHVGRADGNNVSIDQEMLKLTKNNIQYNIGVQLLSKRFAQLKSAVDRSK
ncbi:MAG: flagellar basal body rod protein FlgB [bacterium]|nr:flagellar basal body rod protein FlgB [bacterium]